MDADLFAAKEVAKLLEVSDRQVDAERTPDAMLSELADVDSNSAKELFQCNGWSQRFQVFGELLKIVIALQDALDGAVRVDKERYRQ